MPRDSGAQRWSRAPCGPVTQMLPSHSLIRAPDCLTQFVDAKMAKGAAERADWKMKASGVDTRHRPWAVTLTDTLSTPAKQRRVLAAGQEGGRSG